MLLLLLLLCPAVPAGLGRQGRSAAAQPSRAAMICLPHCTSHMQQPQTLPELPHGVSQSAASPPQHPTDVL